MVEPWSYVGIATSAGVFTSLILLFAPHTRLIMVRLALTGSWLGSVVWVLKVMYQIHKGQDVGRSW